MERIYDISNRRIRQINTDFVRYLEKLIDWNDRLIAIVGVRGSGKTTLLLQHIKKNYSGNEALYISLDDLWFTQNRLVDFVDDFINRGGKYLFIDEVHKYLTWSVEIKNIYDSYPELHIVFTGSSMLEIYKGEGDLSRRVSLYHLYTLSFREYIAFEYSVFFDPIRFDDLIQNHSDIAWEISRKIKPVLLINDYYKFGCLPFYKESRTRYYERLKAVINLILETDLPALVEIDYLHILKLKKLLMIISGNVPFKPNISQLAGKIETERRTLYKYLEYLERAGLTAQLTVPGSGLKVLTKPEKIYLGNPNFCYALSEEQPQIGNIRETFFINQIKTTGTIHYAETADFVINNKYTIEVGGKNKDASQISNLENAFLAIDGIESGSGRRIPLWLFGFMY